MKKIFLLLVFLFPLTTFAISGACSSHGGVNCTIGSSALGNSICNDGWTSSTSFYDTDECKTSLPVCPQPYIWGYTDLSSCDQQQNLCNTFNASRYQSCIMGGSGNCALSTNCAEADACKTQVANNDAAQQRYNQCWDTIKKYQETKLQQVSTENKQLDSQIYNGECRLKFGPNSFYNQSTALCSCQDGFWYDQKTKLCETPSNYCSDTLGYNSQVNTSGTDCECIAGYQVALLTGRCVLSPKENTASSSDQIDKRITSDENSSQMTEKLQKPTPVKKVIIQPQQEKKKITLPVIAPTTTAQIATTSTQPQIQNLNATTTEPKITEIPKRSTWDQIKRAIARLNPFSWF
jgi:hypothetical protein